MINPTDRYRVNYYTVNDTYIRYELFHTEEEAIQFTETTNAINSNVKAKYAGTHEVDFTCLDCLRPIEPEERYIEIPDEEIFYCMDCIDEIHTIEYVTKKGITLGTDNEISVMND